MECAVLVGIPGLCMTRAVLVRLQGLLVDGMSCFGENTGPVGE